MRKRKKERKRGIKRWLDRDKITDEKIDKELRTDRQKKRHIKTKMQKRERWAIIIKMDRKRLTCHGNREKLKELGKIEKTRKEQKRQKKGRTKKDIGKDIQIKRLVKIDKEK